MIWEFLEISNSNRDVVKYAEYCPECYKNGLKSKLIPDGSVLVCKVCGLHKK